MTKWLLLDFSEWIERYGFVLKENCFVEAVIKKILIKKIVLFDEDFTGAQDRSRTYTAVRPLHPECSASTNFATWAKKINYSITALTATPY